MKKLIFICTLFGLIGVVALSFVLYKEYYVDYVMQKNQTYVFDYMQHYKEDECILVEKQVYVPAKDVFGMGGHYQEVGQDSFKESYQEIYHMKYQGFPYLVTFAHSPRGYISCIRDEREDLINIINAYEGNYKLIEKVALDYDCKTTLLSKFNDLSDRYSAKTHFILLYAKDINTAEDVLRAIYENVTGGYIEERKAKLVGDDISMPRYIITNDEDTYNKIANKKEKAVAYLYGFDYECYNSRAITEKIMISNLLAYLIELRHPKRFEAQMIDTVQYIHSSKWLLTYELEYGVAYYLNVYDLDKEI